MPKDKEKKISKKKKPFLKRIWSFFNSVLLTISTMLSLALVSIIGTVVEQNKGMESYILDYGEKWAGYISWAGFDDMFHTWWFTSLLGLLVFNILVCTIERFPPKWKVLLANKPNFSVKFIDKLQHRKVFTVDADKDAVDKTLKAFFKKRKFKFMEEGAEDGSSAFYAWKGVIGRYGSDFTHISLFVILAGAIIGSVYGYKSFKVITVGSTINMEKRAGFNLRLDKFWIDYYDTGQIRQYNSILTVVEDGKDVLEKQIWVNEPLFYRGIRFYQSSWGTSWNKISAAEIGFKKMGDEESSSIVKAKWGVKVDIPESPYAVKVIGYAADFAFDDTRKAVFSKSMEADNPAVMIELYKDGELVPKPVWLFLKYPGLFNSIPGSDDVLIFEGYRSVLFSGISVNKDPGVNIVWIGSCIMGIGFFLAFFVFHKKLYVNLKSIGSSTEVKVGGLINKNTMALEKELEAFCHYFDDKTKGA